MNNCFQMLLIKEKLLQDILSKKRKIKEVSEILQVSRQSISKLLCKYKYEWIDWIKPKKSWPKNWYCWNKTNKEVEDKIIKLAKENYFKWPIWLRDELEKVYNIKINQSTIYRILKRNKQRYFLWYHRLKKKKILYTKDKPWRELQLDVSFPYWYQRKLCIYTAIDDASRYVISKIYVNHNENSSLDFIKLLLKSSKYNIEAVRTDQWREFSNMISKYLESRNIKHIRNPAYTPQYNWKVERYHRTMKENCCIYWKFKSTLEELNYNLKLWVVYYNCTKKHYWLWMNGLTPQEKLESFKRKNPLLTPLL